jgi:hypothetical protein
VSARPATPPLALDHATGAGAGAAVVPPLSDDHAGIDADLAGFGPGIDLIRAGLRLISTTPLTTDQTQTLIAVLSGSPDDTDVLGLLAATIARLADADTNPCLRTLPPDRIDNLRRMGQAYRFDTTNYAPRDLAAEISAHIEGI